MFRKASSCCEKKSSKGSNISAWNLGKTIDSADVSYRLKRRAINNVEDIRKMFAENNEKESNSETILRNTNYFGSRTYRKPNIALPKSYSAFIEKTDSIVNRAITKNSSTDSTTESSIRTDSAIAAVDNIKNNHSNAINKFQNVIDQFNDKSSSGSANVDGIKTSESNNSNIIPAESHPVPPVRMDSMGKKIGLSNGTRVLYNGDVGYRRKHIGSWSTNDVVVFLKEMNLSQSIMDKLYANKVDGPTLCCMRIKDYVNMEIEDVKGILMLEGAVKAIQLLYSDI